MSALAPRDRRAGIKVCQVCEKLNELYPAEPHYPQAVKAALLKLVTRGGYLSLVPNTTVDQFVMTARPFAPCVQTLSHAGARRRRARRR